MFLPTFEPNSRGVILDVTVESRLESASGRRSEFRAPGGNPRERQSGLCDPTVAQEETKVTFKCKVLSCVWDRAHPGILFIVAQEVQKYRSEQV